MIFTTKKLSRDSKQLNLTKTVHVLQKKRDPVWKQKTFRKFVSCVMMRPKSHCQPLEHSKLIKKVRYSATRLLDEKSVAKLSEGHLVSKEVCYHKNCSKRLYNKVREIDSEKSSDEKRDATLQGIAIAEIEQYICHSVETKNKSHWYFTGIERFLYKENGV